MRLQSDTWLPAMKGWYIPQVFSPVLLFFKVILSVLKNRTVQQLFRFPNSANNYSGSAQEQIFSTSSLALRLEIGILPEALEHSVLDCRACFATSEWNLRLRWCRLNLEWQKFHFNSGWEFATNRCKFIVINKVIKATAFPHKTWLLDFIWRNNLEQSHKSAGT